MNADELAKRKRDRLDQSKASLIAIKYEVLPNPRIDDETWRRLHKIDWTEAAAYIPDLEPIHIPEAKKLFIDAGCDPAVVDATFRSAMVDYHVYAGEPHVMSFDQFQDLHQGDDEVIVSNLLARGDVACINGSSKARKSWLMMMWAVGLAAGRDVLGFECKQCRVMIVDYELRGKVLRKRLETVAEAMGVHPDETKHIQILSLRGYPDYDIDRVREYLQDFSFDAMILDPLYKTYPLGVNFDENSNADMAALLSKLQAISQEHSAALLTAHHLTKGSQTNKSLIDLGSGAGALARSVDCHIGIRPEENETEIVTFETVTRSFPPVEPFCLAWSYPLWHRDSRPVNRRKLTEADVLKLIPTDIGISFATIRAEAKDKLGLGKTKIEDFVKILIDQNKVVKEQKSRSVLYRSVEE